MGHKVIFFNLEPWAKEYMVKSPKLAAAGIGVAFEDHILTSDHPAVAHDFDIAGIFVDSKIDAAVIASLPDLRCIAALSTGFDHIDLAACAARDITVSSVPGYGESTVAEFTFALILALSRKIREASRRVHEEGSFYPNGLRGFDLAGKTIGVVGTGHIGVHVIRIAKGFGMNVVAFDAHPNKALAKEAGFSYAALPDLLAQSDIVTLHVPFLPATHHLIDRDNIGHMKRGAYLINTSRGAVVETDALVAALKGGKLAGAGLDVLEEEGMVKDDLGALATGRVESNALMTLLEDRELMSMPNVIVTPHIASDTVEGFTRIFDTTIENVIAFANGAPINVVKAN
jgi:D-lactate dehydrogenase